MAYTLWVFAFEPARWVDKYEWRRLTRGERAALWAFWREVSALATALSDAKATPEDCLHSWSAAPVPNVLARVAPCAVL
jgi:hypothetical protein